MANIVEKNKTVPIFELKANEAKQMFLSIAPETVWKREIGFALQILRSNADAFAKCDPESIKYAVFNVAATGTTLSPVRKEAYLIPRNIKGKLRCCLDFDYKGLIKIATDTGSVQDMDATVVHEMDEFYYEMGLNPVLKHIPSLDPDPGEMTFVYAIAVLFNGLKKFIVLNRADVEKARQKSSAPDSDMWKNFYDEACRKTAIKKLSKMLPRSDRYALAVDLSNQAEGIEFNNQPQETTAKKLMEKFIPAVDVEPKQIEDNAPPAEEIFTEEGDNACSTE